MALGMTLLAALGSLLAALFAPNQAFGTAVVYSALLATGNGLLALLLSHVGSKQSSTKAFFGAVLGGMVFRMGVTLGGFVVGLKVLVLPAAPLASGLLAFTACFIAAEVSLWSRQNFSPKVQLS
jgi:hypothetical protein